MEMNSRVTLQKVSQGYGRGGGEETVTAEKTVWAAVLPPSATLKFQAAAASRSVNYVMYMWRHEFEADDYNRCIYAGKQYRIEADTAAMNDEYVKLMIARG